MARPTRIRPITELADKLNFTGDLRTWIVQTAGLNQTFPRIIQDGILCADLEQVLDWFSDQGLDHLLVRTGFYLNDDGDTAEAEGGSSGDDDGHDEDEEEDENDDDDDRPPRRAHRRR